ncbi:hypothetical protein FCM35_KLT03528 [Carex littledalei]|uniref:Uncharacterized protein n=1 Tax=Carex littledalei TaxID=544730 RepID=A0A833R573_9POAL|nr:hypothetical protein FCM35_KLT03528 [Carex littledalei]
MNAHDETMPIKVSSSLVHVFKKKLGNLPGKPLEAEKFTIFRVPAYIRNKNKNLYQPRMVSIGPYYKDNVHFEAMEEYKWRYLRDYLSRNERNNIERCISVLMGLESQARMCYFEKVKLESDQFLMMMLLDGCFIIEFLIKWSGSLSNAIFHVSWVLPIIRSDFLLLENQIPLFVIEKLFDLLTCSNPVPPKQNTSVSTQIVSKIKPLKEMLLNYITEKNKVEYSDFKLDNIEHILHLYHHVYSSVSPKKHTTIIKLTNERSHRTLPSATELKKAGVIFKCAKSKNILDIKFQNGTLEIPFISIEETRRSRLLNLVSFEQCNSKSDKVLTSYASFMGQLIKTTSDVTLLQQKGIVDNLQATNEELVSFLAWLTECSDLDYDTHYLKDLFTDVNNYYISYWHKSWALLKLNYFNNPWSIMSVIAGAFTLLQIPQTVYSILAYYKEG